MNEMELEQMLSALGDGDDIDHKRLNEILRNDPAARHRYLVWMDMEVCLEETVARSSSSSKLVPFEHKTGDRLRSWTRRLALAASIMLLAAGVATGLRYFQRVAVLTSVTGQVYIQRPSGKVQAESGTWIFSGSEIWVSGSQSEALLTWNDGSLMRLSEACRLAVSVRHGQKFIQLLAGCFNADFQKQKPGKPALIRGPYVNAEILGTSIRMDAREDATRLSVIEGQVRVIRESDHQAVLVTSRKEINAANGIGNLTPQRFLWADRYSGGKQGGTAVATVTIGSKAAEPKPPANSTPVGRAVP
ncbi:MAG: FecR family protein [Verrucomicrobiota bacterium]